MMPSFSTLGLYRPRAFSRLIVVPMFSFVFVSGCIDVPQINAAFNDFSPPLNRPDHISAESIAPAAGPGSLELCGHQYPAVGPQFVGLTLSGGGARAAVLAAAVMFQLRDLGLMDEVDVISAASGGAVAAYYAVSCDDPKNDNECKNGLNENSQSINRRSWQRADVYDRLSRDFVLRSVANRFRPDNLLRTSLTAYDNTDN